MSLSRATRYNLVNQCPQGDTSTSRPSLPVSFQLNKACVLSYWTSPLYHVPSLFANIFLMIFRKLPTLRRIKLENRQGGIPMVGGRLKPVKSTLFWTGGCADLSIYSLKNQTFHSFSSIPTTPNYLPIHSLPSKLSRFYTQLRSSTTLQTYLSFLCIGFYPT